MAVLGHFELEAPTKLWFLPRLQFQWIHRHVLPSMEGCQPQEYSYHSLDHYQPRHTIELQVCSDNGVKGTLRKKM